MLILDAVNPVLTRWLRTIVGCSGVEEWTVRLLVTYVNAVLDCHVFSSADDVDNEA